MRLPRPRVSLKGLMIGVAVVGVALGAARLWRRSAYAAERAVIYGRAEANCRSALINSEGGVADQRRAARAHPVDPDGDRGAAYWARQAEQRRREAAYIAGMARKWRRAAARPWEPVPLDPSHAAFRRDRPPS